MKNFLYAALLFSSVSFAQGNVVASVKEKKNSVLVQSTSSVSSEVKKKCDEEYRHIRFFRAQTPQEKEAWFQECYRRNTVPSVLAPKD